MQLAELAKTYRNFYAPAFSIEVDGKELVHELRVPVSQVEVDLVLGAASRFSFTITDSYHPDSQSFKTGQGARLDLPFGSEVKIQLGYQDSDGMSTLIQGIITEITTDFPEGGSPELTISGFDHSFPLTIGKNSKTWKRARDSDAARDIASYYNLPSKIQNTEEEKQQIEQSQQSDWNFLKKIADQIHYKLFVDETNQLHFHPPNNRDSAEVELVYGEGLLSFKPEANLAEQISGVKIFGWDPNKKAPIIGVASVGQESGRSGESAGDILGRFVRDSDKRPVLHLRQPVFTQAEANQRAQATLDERAKKFLTGEGESIGLPELKPDRNISLKRLGKEFSRVYYIHQATHKIDTNGYRTRFKVEEPRKNEK